MTLQDFLLQKFISWRPTAPEVVSKTKRDITLSWEQETFGFLKEDLLYRVEKNNKLPKWIVVYSGGKTIKRIDDLAPSHPHKFRLKVILKAMAVPHLADKAIQHFGDETSVYDHFNEKHTEDENKTDKNNVMENVGGDGPVKIEITFEGDVKSYGETLDGSKNNNHFDKHNKNQTNSRYGAHQRWIESSPSEETWTCTDSEGTSANCFCMAVKWGYLKQIQSMLEERPELLGIVNATNGFTPLATAVRKGDINTTKFLLTLGAEIDQPSSAGQSPLHLAVLAGDKPIAEHLIEQGADFQVSDWNGLRVEHYAVDSGNLEMLQLIFDKGGDVSVRDFNGWTPLFRAICQGAKTEIIGELVLRGSDLDAVDNAGLPLTSAAKILKNRHGRPRDSIVRLVDVNYPHDKALAIFTRLTRKIYSVHTLFKLM